MKISIEKAIKDNPYDPQKGNKSAYARYLRYNVEGLYNKSNEYVRKIVEERLEKEK